MAKFKTKCGGRELKVNDWDHEPAHCHVLGNGENIRVGLFALAVLSPKDASLLRPVWRCLEKYQAAMLTAWQSVTILLGPEDG